MKHHSGGLEDYLELLELYCMDGSRKRGLLRELAADRNCAAYRIEVHGLKSASANVGAMELSALAKRHEDAAARGDAEFIAGQAESLLARYKEQLEEIEGFLESRRQGGPEEVPEEWDPMEDESLRREIERALECLENFHSKESAEAVEALLHHRLDPETAEKLKEIRELLKMYEDDAAEELLRGLLEGQKRED